ncbi:MAG TPA: hypothetical protein VKX34_07975 [Aequorivita sp.]|nr:hypothetical protein [Aequorivita sp.]
MAEQNYTEEIDLSYLWRKFTSFIKSCIKAGFMVLAFFQRYWLVTLVLLLVGIGYGYYKDQSSSKTFKNEGIVIPNFESVDYLYNNIEDLNKRINNRDTVFLKNILGENHKAIRKIEIEPISDIYNMMTKSREQIDVFRILFQNQELDKFTENIVTGKYFKFHKITFTVKGEGASEEVIKDIQSFWNSNESFIEYGKVYRENAEFQVKEYKLMIAQVDSLIKAFTKESVAGRDSGIIISENNDLHLLLDRKKDMLTDLLQAEVRLSDYTDPIKMVYMDYEVESPSLSRAIKYPIFLIALFGFIFFIGYIYKKMKEIAES